MLGYGILKRKDGGIYQLTGLVVNGSNQLKHAHEPTYYDFFVH
jgi:hypothetical protein